VKTPGIYYATGQKTVLDLISMAGGLTAEGADTCVIQRISGPDQNGKREVENIAVDLHELLIKGRAELNVPVFSGDVIHVPKAGVFFVDGSVGSPGLYQLKDNITLVQALTMAKGLNYEAYRSGIKIYRDNGKPEREVIAANYDEILDGKKRDIVLQDKDIIIVGPNALKTVIKGLAGYMTFGAFSLGHGATY
jgi:polysaccharide export outer membrane protein